MRNEPNWREAARSMRSRFQTFATVVVWYASFITASLVVDESMGSFLERNQYLAALLVVSVLAVGFLAGKWITQVICSNLPNPETT